MFSIGQELKRLEPITLDDTSDEPMSSSAVSQWDELTKALARMGKQQLRANQNVDVALQQAAATLTHAEEESRALREQSDDRRLELQRLREEARSSRLSVLAAIDMLDDLMIMARQKAEPQWVGRIEKLTARTLDMLAEIGLSEIPASNRAFDEQVHEAVDAVDRGDRESYQVVDVIRRGFRHDGTVLRRTQVVATR